MELQSLISRLAAIESSTKVDEAKFAKSGVRATDNKKGKVEKTSRKSYFVKLEKDGSTKGVTVTADEGESQQDVRDRVGRDHKSRGWSVASIREKESVAESYHTEIDEEDVEEGNYFSGQLAAARAAGKKRADLDGDGDLEPVREGGEDYAADDTFVYRQGAEKDHERDIMGMDTNEDEIGECGDMSVMGSGMPQDSMDSNKGHVTITTSADSDGQKTVNISAEGDEAVELMRLLKLSGLGKMQGSDGMAEEMQEGDDAQFANAPHTQVEPLEKQLDQGTDMHAKKGSYSGLPYRGDNPMTASSAPRVESQNELIELERRLFEELESIKVYSKKK